MQAYDITTTSLIMCFLLLLIPIAISRITDLGLINESLISTAKMAVQLLFIGLFLTFLFEIENNFINLAWVMVMMTVAAYTAIRDIDLKISEMYLPIITSFVLGNLLVLMYFNWFVIDLDSVFEARYLIPIGGMLLGNSLRENIVGISDFYKNLRRNENRYMNSLSLGAKKYEALMPYIRKSLRAALRPTIAGMSTVGIVTLPGMMTGQILGGSSPMLAIKYQIAIMIAIYVATVMTVALSILMSIHFSFDEYRIVRKEIFKEARIKDYA